MKKIGIITYNCPHLKTEQIFTSLITSFHAIPVNPRLVSTEKQEIIVYALPFIPRKTRKVFFNHRPNQMDAVSPDILCKAYSIEYINCEKDTDIKNNCDIYIIAGMGILSEEAVRGKIIINCHPGIIPAARGLDSFKWSIFNMIPLGNTLHYIDENVDAGKIISVIPTPVFITDTLETLARRHYENEIKILSTFDYQIAFPQNNFITIDAHNATMRMPFEIEIKMANLFEKYKEKYALPYHKHERF